MCIVADRTSCVSVVCAADDWFHESQLPLWLVKQAEDQMRRWEAQAAAHAAAAAAQAAREAAAAAALDVKGGKGEKRAKEAKVQAEVRGMVSVQFMLCLPLTKCAGQ